MATLQRLWRLNQIDAGLAEIRQRAAALDPGRQIMAEIKTLEAEHASLSGEAHKLSGEQADVDLAQKGIDDKLKKIDKQLYGGSVVNPREVENLEKEIQMLKRQKDKNDERLLELMEQTAPAQKKADDAAKRLNAKKAELSEHQKKVVALKTQLEQEFKRLSAARPEAAQGIDKGLMARYDAIRNKQNGVGMAQVTKQGNCGMCGTKLPTKSIELAKEDRVVTCESCHRILYYTEGLV